MERILLKAFEAPDEPELCEEFLSEHRKVLEDFGISHVTTNNEVWMHDPHCYVIVALHETLGMVGGIRLKIDRPGSPLPMAEAIRKLDSRVDAVLEELSPYGNGEVCGLWNAYRYNGKSLPVLLSQAVTAMAVPAGARRMVCFVAHYTQKHPARNGFIVMENVGDNGFFPGYPIPRIVAIAMVNPDTMLLEHAAEAQRELIYSLRLRPEQTRMEVPGSIPIEVSYRMQLKSSVLDLYAFQQIQEQRLLVANS
ncbi:MAG: hypothetical protein KBH07_09805 [Flavobacteriales bacterium]|nr:hypothetical protein [Flavobacteriales bacterium]MBP9081215.1 hypothetical protein [Flavobacteriales bacterium]